jgi:signal transduction histidine kinase
MQKPTARTAREILIGARRYLSVLLFGPPRLGIPDVALAIGLALAGQCGHVGFRLTYFLLCALLVLIPRAPLSVTTFIAFLTGSAFATSFSNQPGSLQILTSLGLKDFPAATSLLLPLAVAAYRCARLRPGWIWLAPAAATLPSWLAYNGGQLPILTVAVGSVVGLSRQGELSSISLRRQVTLLEQTARQIRSQAISLEERSALARELHDIVGHHVTAIVVLAEAAQAHDESDSKALPRIAESARAALSELDTLVGTLRASPSTSAPRTLADLDELLEPLRANGISASLQVETDGSVVQGVQLSVYRIVQEAVTNVLRHADAAVVAVSVLQADGHLLITVDDDGYGFEVAQVTRGRGLLGIGERVAGHRGTWSAGASPSGGTRLLVELPLRALSPAQSR